MDDIEHEQRLITEETIDATFKRLRPSRHYPLHNAVSFLTSLFHTLPPEVLDARLNTFETTIDIIADNLSPYMINRHSWLESQVIALFLAHIPEKEMDRARFIARQEYADNPKVQSAMATCDEFRVINAKQKPLALPDYLHVINTNVCLLIDITATLQVLKGLEFIKDHGRKLQYTFQLEQNIAPILRYEPMMKLGSSAMAASARESFAILNFAYNNLHSRLGQADTRGVVTLRPQSLTV